MGKNQATPGATGASQRGEELGSLYTLGCSYRGNSWPIRHQTRKTTTVCALLQLVFRHGAELRCYDKDPNTS